jgi:hypothetical protein
MTDEPTLQQRLRDEAVRHVTTNQALFRLLTEAADEIQEYEFVFDLRWKAQLRAEARWREAGKAIGEDRNLKAPDSADLLVWLLDELDRLGWKPPA